MSIQQSSKFNSEQYATILNFLEDPQNKAKIFGVSGKTEVGVAPPRKIEAWKELASLINSKFKGKYKVDHKSMADRWRTYFNKYKATRERSSATGFGITDDDRKRNIHTVQAKLESMCPHYERIHALVGERPNVTPAATFDSGTISQGTDLNELLRFSVEEAENFLDDDPPITVVDCSVPDDITANAYEVGSIPNTFVFCNEEVVYNTPTEEKQATPGPEPEGDDIFDIQLETAATAAAVTERPATFDNSNSKKSKRDRRKELPSIGGTKNPTQTRNHLAQTIQDCASAKANAFASIEEKKLKFKQQKWETEREEREARRSQKMEDEILRRAEEKAEKCRERRFALLQTMLADGKTEDEMKRILALLE